MDTSSPAKVGFETVTSDVASSSAAPVLCARPFAHLGGGSAPSSPELRSPPLNGLSKFKNTINLSTLFQTDTNQSMESKYVRNTIPIFPATAETYQMLILRYLTSMGEYQEVRYYCLSWNRIDLIVCFTNFAVSWSSVRTQCHAVDLPVHWEPWTTWYLSGIRSAQVSCFAFVPQEILPGIYHTRWINGKIKTSLCYIWSCRFINIFTNSINSD